MVVTVEGFIATDHQPFIIHSHKAFSISLFLQDKFEPNTSFSVGGFTISQLGKFSCPSNSFELRFSTSFPLLTVEQQKKAVHSQCKFVALPLLHISLAFGELFLDIGSFIRFRRMSSLSRLFLNWISHIRLLYDIFFIINDNLLLKIQFLN